MPVDNSTVNCLPIVDQLFNCLTPRHQSSHFYRKGTYDTCARLRGNLWTCARAKVKSDSSEALKIMEWETKEINGEKMDQRPTKGVIWSFKERGGWADE